MRSLRGGSAAHVEELQFVGGVGFETLQEQAAKQARERADRAAIIARFERRTDAEAEVARLAKRPGGCNDHRSRRNGKPQAWDFRVRASVTALQVHANLGGEQGAGRAKTTTRVDGNHDQGSAAQQQARAAMKFASIIAAMVVVLATPAAA